MLAPAAPTAWTVLQQNGPDHLGLWYNMLPWHQIALITSDCLGAVQIDVSARHVPSAEAPEPIELHVDAGPSGEVR